MNAEKKQYMKRIALTILALDFGLAASSWAQNAAPSTDDSFAKYGQEFKGKIGRTYAESVEWYPETVKPKPGTPNVFIIYLDDVGFAQYGCFGGLIKTPNIDALAADGLRYNNFHTPALCSPSRAALMAGPPFFTNTRACARDVKCCNSLIAIPARFAHRGDPVATSGKRYPDRAFLD